MRRRRSRLLTTVSAAAVSGRRCRSRSAAASCSSRSTMRSRALGRTGATRTPATRPASCGSRTWSARSWGRSLKTARFLCTTPLIGSAAGLINSYDVRKFCKLDFSFAPQLVTSSSNAIETPSIRWRLEPLAMVQLLCPDMGQLQASPTQATGIPPTLKFVARVLITLPPWEVASPSRITLRMVVLIYCRALGCDALASGAVDALVAWRTAPTVGGL